MYFHKAELVEVASVLGGSDIDQNTVKKILDAMKRTFIVISEESLFNKALEEVLSGFNTHFIALASKIRALLLADDAPMAIQARNLNIETVLIRNVGEEEILRKLDR